MTLLASAVQTIGSMMAVQVLELRYTALDWAANRLQTLVLTGY